MQEPVFRDDLLDGYVRPYRRWLPVGWRANGVPQLLLAAAVVDLATLGAALVLVDGAPLVLVVLAALVTAVVAVWTTWTTVVALQVIRRRAADWRSDGGELGRTREGRPHAGAADPELLHDEYAVAVTGDGRIVTWAFTPLQATAPAPEGMVLVPGMPCFAAEPVDERRLRPADGAQTAQQVADAQAAAAARETAAARLARELVDGRGLRLEESPELRSTTTAPRRHAGQ